MSEIWKDLAMARLEWLASYREELKRNEDVIKRLRAQLATAEAERDAARGEAAGYREALVLIDAERNCGCKPICQCRTQEALAVELEERMSVAYEALKVPGKSISEWQAEALEEAAEIVRQTTIDGRSASNRQRGIFQGRYEVIDHLLAEAARLRVGGGE